MSNCRNFCYFIVKKIKLCQNKKIMQKCFILFLRMSENRKRKLPYGETSLWSFPYSDLRECERIRDIKKKIFQFLTNFKKFWVILQKTVFD